MRIVFDVDNVILDWNTKFEKYLKIFFNIEKREFRTYEEVAPYLIDFQKNIDQEYNYLPGMKKLIIELAKEHEIILFTNLPTFLVNKRLENLKDLRALGLSMYFFDNHKRRIEGVLEYAPDIYIDDRPGTLIALAGEFKGKLLAPTYSYNYSTIEELKNVVGYNNSLELEQLIRRYVRGFQSNVLRGGKRHT